MNRAYVGAARTNMGRLKFTIGISQTMTGKLPDREHLEQLAEHYNVELTEEVEAELKRVFPGIEI